MRRCPACDAPLFRRRFDDVTLDGCKSCGGIFFDGNELSALGRARPELLREADEAFKPGMQPAVANERTDRCPACTSERLVAGEHPHFPGIAMAMCARCKGIFLAHGGALALADRIAPAPSAPSPAARASVARATEDATSTADLPVVRGELLARDGSHDSGLVGSFERGVRFFGAALSLARECPKLLVPIYLGIGANIGGFLVVALVLYAWLPAGALEDEVTLDAWLDRTWGGVLAIMLGSGLAGSFISYAAMGMTVSGVDAYLKGRAPQLGIALRDVMKNAGGIAALAIVSFLVEIVVSALRGRRRRASFLTSMVARAIETAWTVLAFLLLPVVMIEDVGLLTALRRVRDIHRNNLLTIAVSEVGIRLVLGLAGTLIGVALYGVVHLVEPTSTTAIVSIVVVFGIVGVVLNGFSVYLRATYYTCLYLWAVAIEREPDAHQIRAAGPLAAAMA